MKNTRICSTIAEIANGQELIVGRETVDELLPNGYIGRQHICVGITLEGDIYLRDMNSTNGSFIKARRLPKGVNVQVEDPAKTICRLSTPGGPKLAFAWVAGTEVPTWRLTVELISDVPPAPKPIVIARQWPRSAKP